MAWGDIGGFRRGFGGRGCVSPVRAPGHDCLLLITCILLKINIFFSVFSRGSGFHVFTVERGSQRLATNRTKRFSSSIVNLSVWYGSRGRHRRTSRRIQRTWMCTSSTCPQKSEVLSRCLLLITYIITVSFSRRSGFHNFSVERFSQMAANRTKPFQKSTIKYPKPST